MPELPDADDLLEDDDLTDSVPRIVPVYSDLSYQELGERLAALYFARDTEGSDDQAREDAILKTAAAMRRGPRLHAGEFLADGRYRLIDSLGSSGSNAHWKAWDRASGRFVYLSVFHDLWSDDDAIVETFRKRGKQLVKLEHDNIGRVFDADRSVEGWVYVAQAYFAMGNLTGRAGRDGFDAIAALQVVVEIAEALRHAHDAGVVHGDVRPENVMLSSDGTAHLVDFAVGTSGGGAGWGSLYAAPETSERGYRPQPAADVYGLGMTALFALHRADLPVWVLRDPGRLIASIDAPEAIKRVVGKATEWELAKRYPDVRTLLRELMSDPELVRILADRALDRDRLSVGAGHFEKLLKTQPHRGVEYRTILGDVYTRMGSYDMAHGHFAKALERTPDVGSLFPALRTVAERTGQWGRLAELLWTQARQRDAGRRVLLRAELADINEHQLDDPTSAREVWGQVLAEHRTPDQAARALRALMRLCRAVGDGEAFVAYGQELLSYLPQGQEGAAVEYAIGRTLIEQLGRIDEGLPWIDQAEGHGHSELDFAATLQQIRADRGQWRRVIRLMIAQARQQDLAEASPTLLRAGIIAGSVHHEEEAFEVYHSLLERAPRHVVALRHLARMHHRAHQPARALPFYERLWDTYRGRDTEEPEASERAADCAAYASILLRQGRADEAMERLHEALRLTPFHVPSLQVAGPMLLARGEVDAAADVFDRLLRAFKSVERTPQKVEACLGMGDLAWIQGRITPAMGWYNRALELEPFSVRAWWGLAKVALTARGGHPGVDRAPWVKAVPKRLSTSEALARLLASMLDPTSMANWLRLTPLGSAIVDGGDCPMRLACGVAEVLIRNDLAGSDLYDRLGEAFPDWAEPLDVARGLCTEGRTTGFPLHVAYGWTESLLGDEDFDPDVERHVLPPEPAPVAGTSDVLTGPSAWGALFQNARVEPRPPKAWIQTHEPTSPIVFEGQVAALVRDQVVWLLLAQHQEQVRFGREDGCDMQIIHDESVVEGHGRLYRQAGRIYVQAENGPVMIDGEARSLWRLVGGERVTIGETRFAFEAVDDVNQLPPKRRKPVRKPKPEPRPEPVAEPVAAALAEEEEPDAVDAPQVDVVAEPSEAAVVDPSEEASPQEDAPEPAEAAVEAAPIAEEAPLPDDEPDVPEEVQEAASDLREEEQAAEAPAVQDDFPAQPDITADDDPSVELDEAPAAEAEPEVEDALSEEVEATVLMGIPPEVLAAAAAADGPVAAGASGAPVATLQPETPFAPDDPPGDGSEEDSDEILAMPSISEEVPREEVEAILAQRAETTQVASDYDVHEEDEEVIERVPPLDPSAVDPSHLTDVGPSSDAEELSVDAPVHVDDGDGMDAPVPDDDGVDAPPVPTLQGTPVIVDEPPPVKAPTPTPTLAPVEDAPAEEGASPAADDDEAGVFGFPSELANDDVDALQGGTTPLPSGIRSAASPSMPPEPMAAATPRAAALEAPAPAAEPEAPADDGVDGLFASSEAAANTAVLEYMSGADRGQQVAVSNVLTVGQSKHCGMSIPSDTRLSPVHCKVERTLGGYKLVDEGSANGTVVNGARITEIDLHGGEVIMVGRTVLRFRILEEG